jgi:hypothetical protein
VVVPALTTAADFADMMTDTIVFEKFVAHTGLYAASTYAAPVNLKGRVVRENRLVRSDTGEEAVSRTHASIIGAPWIDPLDRLTLPDGTQPLVMTVDRFPDENGPLEQVVYFGGA